jgi:hypothetical protein
MESLCVDTYVSKETADGKSTVPDAEEGEAQIEPTKPWAITD